MYCVLLKKNFRMVKEWEKKFLDAEECQTRHFAEDVFVGKCLQKLNATLLNTADNEGRYRYETNLRSTSYVKRSV